MTRDVETANLWDAARAIWSQWDGYLKAGPGKKLKSDLEGRGIPLDVIHTSGHSSIADLKRLAKAFRPDRLIPIHTFEGDSFSKYSVTSHAAMMVSGGTFNFYGTGNDGQIFHEQS